jgi:protein-S-isoprenylcysteine O-methyltransferase Ste14
MNCKTKSHEAGGRLNAKLKQLRKYKILSLTIAFLILIAKDIIMYNKPHEFDFGRELSTMALIGAILVLAGVLVRLWARGYFEKGRLFTTGPYALVRHPLYLGSFLIVIGILCQLNSRLNWSIIIPIFGFFHGIAIIYEERSLAIRFGETWTAYKSQIPPLVPSLRSLLNANISEKWDLCRFLRTHEYITTVIVLSLPLFIEALEDFVFEGILHV